MLPDGHVIDTPATDLGLRYNEERSKVEGDKLRIVIEGPTLQSVSGPEARELAAKVARDLNYGQVAFDPLFDIYPVDADTDKCVERLGSEVTIKCHRVDFLVRPHGRRI